MPAHKNSRPKHATDCPVAAAESRSGSVATRLIARKVTELEAAEAALRVTRDALAEDRKRAEAGARLRVPTLRERVVDDPAYRAAAAGPYRGDVELRCDIADARQLAQLLRTRANIAPDGAGAGLVHPIPVEQWATSQPRPARVMDLFRLVPIESPLVQAAITGGHTGSAGGVPYGAAFPQLDSLEVDSEEILTQLYPWFASVQRNRFADAGIFGDVVDRIFRQELPKSLERDCLTGDGTSDAVHATPLGLLNLDLPTDDIGSGTRLEALAQAVADVQNADFYDEPLSIVASPSTLKAIRTENDGADRPLPVEETVPDVAEWVPSTAVPDGTALVGAFNRAVLFIHGNTELEVSSSHSDYFLSGLLALRVRPSIAFRAPQPAAFKVVTGM